MTQVGIEAKSTSELDNLEKWIAQKRAEIKKEKATIASDDKENSQPSITSKSQPPPSFEPVQHSEPLIFKLGDDYQLRKAKFNDELKSQLKNTQIEQDALKRAISRQSYDKSNAKPYFEVVGQDLFQKRPSTAQVKAAKQAAYKRELEAQLKQREADEKNRKRAIRLSKPQEFIIQSGNFSGYNGGNDTRTQPADNSTEDIRVQTPKIIKDTPLISNKDTPRNETSSVNQNPYSQNPVPPGYGYYPNVPPGYYPPPTQVVEVPKTPARDHFELSSALERGTMENVINQARLDSKAIPTPRESYNYTAPLPPPIQVSRAQEFPENPRDSRKSVQIHDTKMISPRKYGNDIFNTGHIESNRGRGEVQKENYARELFQQMREKDQKKADEKRKQELYDKKLEREMLTYDPFGKGGGGAPVRDTQGRLMTDLRQMKVLNDTVQNNMDKDDILQVYELKDVDQKDVTTPRPPAHSRIDSPPVQRITEYNQPRQKVDFDYRDYLLAEAARKKKEKEELAARERAEDAKAEARFLQQQEQLRLEADLEKSRKIEEEKAKVAAREQQFIQRTPAALPKGRWALPRIPDLGPDLHYPKRGLRMTDGIMPVNR